MALELSRNSLAMSVLGKTPVSLLRLGFRIGGSNWYVTRGLPGGALHLVAGGTMAVTRVKVKRLV